MTEPTVVPGVSETRNRSRGRMAVAQHNRVQLDFAPRSMQHADDHHRIGHGTIIDRIATMERDAQPRCQLLARRRGKRKVAHGFEGRLDCRDKP